MPTYTFTGLTARTFNGLNNKQETVQPGGELITYDFLVDDELTLTLDTPLKNQKAAETAVTVSGSEVTHDLNAETQIFYFRDIIGTITAKPQVSTAAPLGLNLTDSSAVVIHELSNYPCNKILFTGTGTCVVVELKW